MQDFEINDIYNARYVDPYSKDNYNYDIQAIILKPSLETGLSLSKKVNIAIFKILIIIVVI
jgi:hypothetical protein